MYCPKCGNKVEEGMAFCPRCGASLKMEPTTAPSPPPASPMRQEKAEKGEKNEKQEKQQPEKGEKHESRFGFLGFLVGGLILILIGAVAYINATTNWLNGPLASSLILLLIGVIIIIVGVYVATVARRHMPQPA